MASTSSRRATSLVSRQSTIRNASPIDFEPQQQEMPLNPQALMSLQSLQRGTHTTISQHGSNLDGYLRTASELLQSIAGDINDRGAEERERFQEKQRKLREKERAGESFEPITADQISRHEAFNGKVEAMTEQMYLRMRTIVDDKQWRLDTPAALKHVADMSGDVSNRAAQQDQDEETRVPVHIDSGETPSSFLHAAQSTNQTAWQALSLHDKYAVHNDYKQLYKIVWDSRHPGENQPPVPHASLWFPEDGSKARQAPQASQRRPLTQNTLGDSDIEMQETNGSEDDDDDDLEVFAANKRITCPLTLQHFKDPVSSNKCPHSFEKAAITELIRNSNQHVPFTDEQQAQLSQYSRAQDRRRAEEQFRRTLPKAARCPEAGCEIILSAADLYDDPALLRRTKRIVESQRRQAELEGNSDDEDADLPRGTQRRRIVALGSSPAGSRRNTTIKGERLSTVPNTQPQEDVDDVDEG